MYVNCFFCLLAFVTLVIHVLCSYYQLGVWTEVQ